MAKNEGYNVSMALIGDDCSLMDSPNIEYVGKRGNIL